MCGIAGYINNKGASKVDEALLVSMHQSMEHRGPNDSGIWKSDVHGLGLAHRRLSIVDLSANGHQPMLDKDESVVICFNGEIYNYLELRKELEGLGYKYFSNTDTETLIHAYKEWGISFIHKLDGMFAIALFDIKKNELYLIRDRIGIKPLYFSNKGGFTSFASEIKALWKLPWMQKDINTLALYHSLTFLTTPAPMTMYKGVYKLPAGFYAKIGENRELIFYEWYNPLGVTPDADTHLLGDEEFCIQRIRELLRSSIKKRMMSDVPFGVFLSGGIDSSLNVALMSEFTSNVKTFNVVFSDGLEYDERKWARKVSKQFATQHQEIVISEKEAFNFYEKMVYHQDEPLADWVCIPLYFVSKLAKESGVTVVQCGEGADELFCGYDAYAHYLNMYKRYWWPSQRLLPKLVRRGVYGAFSKVFSKRDGLLEHVGNWAQERNLFWGGAIAFKERQKQKFFLTKNLEEDEIVSKICSGMKQNFDSHSVIDYHLSVLKTGLPRADFLQSMLYLELKQRLPELLLMRLDKMTMATSVEGRVPFLDHALVEFAMHVSSNLKYKNGTTKYILKKACEGILPNDVIYRKKVGFAAPVNRWFKSGKFFRKHYLGLAKSKGANVSTVLDSDYIGTLLDRHASGVDVSPQLWTLQNVISFL